MGLATVSRTLDVGLNHFGVRRFIAAFPVSRPMVSSLKIQLPGNNSRQGKRR